MLNELNMQIEKDYDHLIERIYDRYDNVVRRIVHKGVDMDEAPDLAIKLMLDAVGALHQLREPDKLDAWLNTIVDRGVSRYFKEQAITWEKEISHVMDYEAGEEIDIYDLLADETDVEELIRIAEKTDMIMDVLNCLADKEWSIFVMRNLDGFKFREISEILDINENTVKTIHRRSCIKLKKQAERLYRKEDFYDWDE